MCVLKNNRKRQAHDSRSELRTSEETYYIDVRLESDTTKKINLPEVDLRIYLFNRLKRKLI